MTSTSNNSIAPPDDGINPEQAKRRAQFQKLQIRLREQRRRMEAYAACEFQQVVYVIGRRLHVDEQADLIAFHVREVWSRFALSLPENWERDMAAYVRKDVKRDPWFRAPMAEQIPMTPDEVREFAKFLVASHRRTNMNTSKKEVAHA